MNSRLRWLKGFSKACTLFYAGLYLMLKGYEEGQR